MFISNTNIKKDGGESMLIKRDEDEMFSLFTFLIGHT